VVSDLLGHSSVAITGDVYAHAVVRMQRQGTARLTERLQQLRAATVTDSNKEVGPIESRRSTETVHESLVGGRVH
jgi:hypothetical protein